MKNAGLFKFFLQTLSIKYALKKAKETGGLIEYMVENREVWEKENEMAIFFGNLGNNGRLFSSFDFVLSERGFVIC